MSKLTVKKVYEDLDYWKHIHIADDILNMPEQRKEYQHLVRRYLHIKKEARVDAVLLDLKLQLAKPFFRQRTFYHLLIHNLRMRLGRMFGQR